MYLVLAVQHNRVISATAFHRWESATLHADTLAITLNRGVDKKMLKWEKDDYRNVYENDGVAIMIEPLVGPYDTKI